MEELRFRLLAATRPELLVFLAAAISDMTIYGRSHYDSADAADRLRATNEAIHRLVGHLRDLIDLNEPCTESRVGGIAEQLGLLPPTAISRLLKARD
jgi:hypothetical protein